MVNKTDTLARLNKEKDYEDKLVCDLNDYFLNCLDDINDISQEDKDYINEKLSIIINESMNHSRMFNELIQVVFNDEKDNF